jgi:hypothetical protein
MRFLSAVLVAIALVNGAVAEAAVDKEALRVTVASLADLDKARRDHEEKHRFDFLSISGEREVNQPAIDEKKALARIAAAAPLLLEEDPALAEEVEKALTSRVTTSYGYFTFDGRTDGDEEIYVEWMATLLAFPAYGPGTKGRQNIVSSVNNLLTNFPSSDATVARLTALELLPHLGLSDGELASLLSDVIRKREQTHDLIGNLVGDHSMLTLEVRVAAFTYLAEVIRRSPEVKDRVHLWDPFGDEKITALEPLYWLIISGRVPGRERHYGSVSLDELRKRAGAALLRSWLRGEPTKSRTLEAALLLAAQDEGALCISDLLNRNVLADSRKR